MRKEGERERETESSRKKSLPNSLSQTLLITIINAHFLNNGLSLKVRFFSYATAHFSHFSLCVRSFIRIRIGINNLLCGLIRGTTHDSFESIQMS